MNKKIFLTSAVVLGFACPAMAEPSNTGTFPQNGLMQEDYTYEGAATSTNMAGVYQDGATVYANAQYSDATYEILAGTYLPANSETTIDCDQNGYFCPGDDNGVNYSSSAQGLTQCPTGYGNSGTGAAANTDCYRTCTNNDVAHSTGTVNGGYYYGDNNQCEPTDCVNGWHVKAGTPDLMTVIGVSEAAINSGYKANSDAGSSYRLDLYNITHYGEFVVDYGNKGKIHGYARCSTRGVENIWYNNSNTFEPDHFTETLPESDGQNCYCQLDGYTVNGSQTTIDLSSPWVFQLFYDGSGGTDCQRSCAGRCVYNLQYDFTSALAARAAMFGTVSPTLASCEANTINISWDGATTAAVSANDAATVTYGGDIRTPQSAIHVPGKVFDGWEFSTTAPQNPVTE